MNSKTENNYFVIDFNKYKNEKNFIKIVKNLSEIQMNIRKKNIGSKRKRKMISLTTKNQQSKIKLIHRLRKKLEKRKIKKL